MTTIVSTSLGVLLLLLVAYDVYSTILDDRPRVGPISDTLNRAVWHAGRAAASRLGRAGRHRLLNLLGPLLLPVLLVFYIVFVAAGFALIYYPHMHAKFAVSHGAAGAPWFDSFYFSGVTLTTVGYGDIAPLARSMRLVALFESASGIALISLSITYLIAVYQALERKRTVALSFYHQAEEGANVASFVAHHFVGGRFYGIIDVLRPAARDLHGLLESHVEHPIIHYFHPVRVYKSLPRILFLTLETAAVLRACLDAEAYPETCNHPEVRTLEASSRHVLGEFTTSLGLAGGGRTGGAETFEESSRWRKRYEQTIRRLRQSGIATRRDEAAGWEEYRAKREEWESPLKRFADYLGYDWDEVTGDGDLRAATDEGVEETLGGG
ncbi:MAG: potassium channel family protein [Acidobacteria bacterium]|nr:potassium channel family protein [Acidobacteriota bacterium]